eukprot:10960906-Alexandrium_andersonii.AAC.1
MAGSPESTACAAAGVSTASPWVGGRVGALGRLHSTCAAQGGAGGDTGAHPEGQAERVAPQPSMVGPSPPRPGPHQ